MCDHAYHMLLMAAERISTPTYTLAVRKRIQLDLEGPSTQELPTLHGVAEIICNLRKFQCFRCASR